MTYIKKLAALIICFFILISFKEGANETPVNKAPTNLRLNAVASTDGTGKVTFVATATKAISYTYEFGNGDVKTVPSGTIDYQYTVAGTNTYTVTVIASGSKGLSIKTTAQISVTKAATPTLLWSEEFNKDGVPDSTKWGYDIGTGSNGWGNAELEYYTNRPENVIVQNGVLKITAIKENYKGSTFTSARLLSKNKFAFTYGRVEIKAKVPAGAGTWPATWMLGADDATTGWPGCGEIDVMEHLGRTLNTIYGTLHYPGHSGGNADGTTTVIKNAATEFHIYSLDWTPTTVNISVDGLLFHTTANSKAIPFNHDFFFILDLAMGGGFGGPVDPAFTTGTMEVDYIRVYK